MNDRTRQRALSKRGNGSPLPTVCFLLVAAAVVCGCVLLVSGMAKRELGAGSGKRMEAAPGSPSVSPVPAHADTATTPEARMAAALRTPAPVTPTPLPAATIPPETPAPTASPTPAPTLLPPFDAREAEREGVDVLLVGFDEAGRADLVAAARVRKDGCRVVSIPRNTVCPDGTPLSAATTPDAAAALVETVFPVRFRYTATIALPALAACIDRFDGVRVEGRRLTGAQAERYLAEGPADELLRVARQQTVMRAFAATLSETSWLSLLSAKLALQPQIDSDIPLTKLLELYALLMEIPQNKLTFTTLPVDSVTFDGERRYAPDIARVNALAEAFAQ